MEKISSILANHFKKWGVTHVFGIPGKAVVPLLLEIDDKGIDFVLSRHETGAGYEAAGYSLLSNKIGVAICTSGPGGTNLITAAAQAKASHIPVLLITGHPSIGQVGKAMGQDSSQFGTDLVDMFKSVTKFSARVERGDQMRSYLKHALEKAFSGVKGPVHLSIPADVLLEEVEPFELELPDSEHVISSRYHDVIDILNRANHPVLFLGKGVHASKAYEEIRMMAECWNIPVMTTPGGKGAFQTRHPLSLGGFGLGGTDEAHDYIKKGVDVMIVIGTKLSDMSLAGLSEEQWPVQVIQFDYDQTFVGKSLETSTLFIPGDIKRNLQLIISEVMRRGAYNGFNAYPHHEKSSLPLKDEQENGTYMSSERSIHIINEVLPDETILFGDAGSHSFYAIKNLNIEKPGTFFFDDVFGAMGNAIGLSIGAKLASSPHQKVICLTGDGCMLMHGAEVSTAVNANAAVVFIVFNNSGLDMVDKGMKKHVGKAVGASFACPVDIYQWALSMGALPFKCRTSAELRQSLQTAILSHKTAVVEIIVDPDELPPTMRRG
ncbi:thiamine pyrophosphate-binding protein [Bacillus sp. HMF5848]|nr:thiamine pyrophosphate-binding protein [Bacillus sp. HMF5848]